MNKGFASFVLALCCAVGAHGASIELISRAAQTTSSSATGASLGGSYSPDGAFILFSSTAADLVNLPGLGHFNLYALNRTNRNVELISASTNGALGNQSSFAGGMSRDGRYVVFQSSAKNLTPQDTNGVSDIFVRDRVANSTMMVSYRAGFYTGNDVSEFPEISEDGKWVAFLSHASDLVASDTNRLRDVFAWDRIANKVELVSAGLNGEAVSAEVTDFSLSANGRYVLFTASGTNLVEANRGGGSDVYLRDLQTKATRWVSAPVTNLSGFSSNSAANAAMSADGRYVFMLATPRAPAKSAFVRVDLNDDSVLVVATNLPTQPTYSDLVGPSVSEDGQAVVFSTQTNIFYWRAGMAEATRVDVTSSGALVTGAISDTPVISRDGKKVAFLSTGTNLVADIGNGEAQIYVRDMVSGVTRLVTKSLAGEATLENGIASFEFSPDGTELLFDSGSDVLVAQDNNEDYDLFAWNVASGAVSLVSESRAGEPSLTADGGSAAGKNSVSADGRFVVFRSQARLSLSDTNSALDLYVYDRVAKTNTLITAWPNGMSGTVFLGALPMISANGKKVVFEATAPGMAGATDTRAARSIYVRDLETGGLSNISGTNTGNLTLQMITENGRYVYFTTSNQLHRYDLVENVDLLEATATGGHSQVRASADGSRVVYRESLTMYIRDYPEARFLVQPGAGASSALNPMLTTNGATLVYAKPNEIIVTNIGSGVTNSYAMDRPPIAMAMSADANIIAFQKFTAGGLHEIWFLDRATAELKLISQGLGTSTNGNGGSEGVTVSADGRYIAFESWASDLVIADINGQKDVFVYDRLTGKLSFGSAKANDIWSANSGSFNPAFGPGANLLVFTSFASDMAAGDLNDDSDVYGLMLETETPSDSDNDGLDDSWERTAFSTLSYGANDDPDGDGATNREEFLAGTNANSASSSFGIAGIEVAATGSAELTFKSVANHRYRIEFTASLTSPQWTAIGAEVNGSQSGETTVSIPSAGEGYYRLRLVE